MTTARQPLAARMRPTTLQEIVGQGHLIFPGSPLELLAQGRTSASVLLYGPPGSGKTTIASVVAHGTDQRFVELSATSAGVKDVRKVLDDARRALTDEDVRTLVFIDETHRFSKAQQDVLLPAVEDGTISLIGATTENPSFSVNAALVSRSILLVLEPLTEDDLVALVDRALGDPRGFDGGVSIRPDAAHRIARLASGDARQTLTLLELIAGIALANGRARITMADVDISAASALQRYDRDGDQHYDIISAFIKSMRGSDPDAALYWLARMIEAGEDPRFIARRLVVHASEDVGMADPSVLSVAVAAAQAVQLIGMPEARINLAQATIAIATAPKSPAVYRGIDGALADVKAGHTHSVPMRLRDSHYPGATALGHGEGYLYPHDFEHGIVGQQYLPDALLGAHYYEPTGNGFEQIVARRLTAIDQITRTTEESS